MCLEKPMEIVGMGFRPTDEELVDFYLKHKLLDDDPLVHVLTDIDLSDVEPWEIPEMLAKSVIAFKTSEWFFFSPVNLKYSNSKRFKRTTKSGFWKPTGKPRDVRTGDTDTVIGTKKTLVFQSGNVSKGVAVNSNWVIHEYHALNFLQSQNAFVLCRLKKKHGKTAEGGTAALISDEEESSRSVVSDNEHQAIAEGVPSGDTFSRMETICQLTYQAEINISPTEQSLIDIEQDEASFPNPSNDAYFIKEINNRHIPYAQTPFETMHTSLGSTQNPGSMLTLFEPTQPSFETTQASFETRETPFDTLEALLETMQSPLEAMPTSLGATHTPPEMMYPPSGTTHIPLGSMQTPFGVTSPLASRKIPFESRKIQFQNTHTPSHTPFEFPKSLKRTYCESTCINPEVVLKLDDSIEDSSTMCTEYLNSDEYHSSKRFKTSYDVVDGDIDLLFSNQEASQKQESIFQDDFWGVETSSCDSTVYNPEEINWNEISSFPCT